MDREARIEAGLNACLEGLRLASREGKGGTTTPVRWNWVAVGIVSALKAALVAALSGYELATDADVSDPSNPDHIAPVALLLRRARGTEFLNPPERLDLPTSISRRIERVLALRNQTLHALGAVPDERIAEDVTACLAVISHLTLEHPAFDPAPHTLTLALLKDDLSTLSQAVSRAG